MDSPSYLPQTCCSLLERRSRRFAAKPNSSYSHLLADGPIPSDEIFKAAKAVRISESTLRRAKKRLHVDAERKNSPGGKRGDGKWVWKLPETVPAGNEVQGVQGRECGHLERDQGVDSAESSIDKSNLQGIHENGADGFARETDHLEDDARGQLGGSLLAGEIARELNRPDSRAGEIAVIYKRGDIPLSLAVESIAKAMLSRKGEDEIEWRASAPVVEAALTHPISCICEWCL